MSTSSEEKQSFGSNPFEEESVDSSQNLSVNMESVRQRGALIQGVTPASERGVVANGDDDDLEIGSEAPDSDYASHVPRSLWQPNVSSEDIRHHVVLQPNRSESDAKRRSISTLWITLGLISVVLIGVVAAVA